MPSDPAYSAVEALGVQFSLLEHPSTPDIKEWSSAIKNSPHSTSISITKSLFAKPKTAKADPVVYYLIIAAETSQFSVADVGKALKLKELRIATEDAIKQTLNVDKDHVTPFALANIADKTSVKVVLDTTLTTQPASALLCFRGLTSDKSVSLSWQEIQKFLTTVGVEVVESDLSVTKAAIPDGAPATSRAEPPKKDIKDAKKAQAPAEEGTKEVKIGLEVKKEENFSTWYQQVVVRSEMLDYYDISGCYILRPWSYKIWKEIQNWFGSQIEKLGVEDCYFPMFVSKRSLEREKDHIEGFAPEVAWVTHAGESELAEHIAVRPTSETVMYPYYGQWIRSHRDLPLRLNQWNNVVRWEFKYPQPFLRTREFLWQEGHTAFATLEEAAAEVLTILDLYCRVYEELLAVPMVKGTKSEKEKFAGGLYTTTVEGFIPTTGRGIQGATSHCLGQNFAKMFDISILDEKQEKQYVWQNSWGLTTRTLGVMVMVHGDDKGLVLPPRVASIQVIVVPVGISAKSTADDRAAIEKKVEEVVQQLLGAGVRAKSDLRDNVTSGYKFNHWELRGVPIRLEIGPKDLQNKSIRCVLRYNSAASSLPLESLDIKIKALLEEIQSEMFKKAKEVRASRTVRLETWDNFVKTLNARNLVLAPWCEAVACEDAVKERSAKQTQIELQEAQDERAPSMGAKSLCIPHEQPKENPLVPGVTKCFQCGKDAKSYTLFGRSY